MPLFPEPFRPEHRRTYKAYDGLNNLFNLGYRVLSWKVHLSLMRSKLEPYLGFLHSVQWGTPSLVCDFQELYRYLVDDFVIDFCKSVTVKDFILKKEVYARNKFGKRQYINKPKKREFLDSLGRHF